MKCLFASNAPDSCVPGTVLSVTSQGPWAEDRKGIYFSSSSEQSGGQPRSGSVPPLKGSSLPWLLVPR